MFLVSNSTITENNTFWAENLVEVMWNILEIKSPSVENYTLIGNIISYLHNKCDLEYGWWCQNIP